MYFITKLIALSNKNNKSDNFYSRFKDQLLESQSWPGIYLFKFIVKNNEGKIAEKSSSNNKFLTFTFEYYANSPSEVIDIYKGLEFIDNIISL